MITITWTLVSLWTGLDVAMQTGINGGKSILSMFFQFLPIIITISVLLFLITRVTFFVQNFSSGWKSKWAFKTSQKH